MVWHYKRDAEQEAEFNVLITLMADMITAHAQANYGDDTAPAWLIDLHRLAMKLFKHLCSARTLLEPCEFSTPTLPARAYIDHSSLIVVVRSSIENYLVMHWLHADGDEAIRTFRHNVWMYGGWKKRSKFFASVEVAKAGKQRAIEDAAALLPQIEASPIYQSYSSERKKALRQGNWQAGTPWNQLAEEAGLHRTYFASIYPYLSGYAHSDFISSIQVGQAVDLQTQYQLALSSLQVSLMILGHSALFYANLFPAAQAVFDDSDDARALVGKWSFKAEDMDFLYSQDDPDE